MQLVSGVRTRPDSEKPTTRSRETHCINYCYFIYLFIDVDILLFAESSSDSYVCIFGTSKTYELYLPLIPSLLRGNWRFMATLLF